jgi:antirestriction protein ArdC
MLWAAAMEKGYNCPLWLTYKQAAELGGQVRKGEKGSLVVYASTFTKTEAGENGEDVEHEIPFMKGYTVFNAEQIDGLPANFYATVAPLIDQRPWPDASIYSREVGKVSFCREPEMQSVNAGASFMRLSISNEMGL